MAALIPAIINSQSISMPAGLNWLAELIELPNQAAAAISEAAAAINQKLTAFSFWNAVNLWIN